MMGWASGSRIFSKVIEAVKHEVPCEESRKNIYRKLIKEFEQEDCDTLGECFGEDSAYDVVYNESVRIY